jgi:hypothetical protein
VESGRKKVVWYWQYACGDTTSEKDIDGGQWRRAVSFAASIDLSLLQALTLGLAQGLSEINLDFAIVLCYKCVFKIFVNS